MNREFTLLEIAQAQAVLDFANELDWLTDPLESDLLALMKGEINDANDKHDFVKAYFDKYTELSSIPVPTDFYTSFTDS